MSDTTPDTTAIRRRQGPPWVPRKTVLITEAERDALCDGYDEAQRLRSAWATERDGAEGLAADLHAARQALADLIGELRGLCEPYRDDQPVFVRDEDLLAVIDRHDPGLFQCTHCERFKSVDVRIEGDPEGPGPSCEDCAGRPL